MSPVVVGPTVAQCVGRVHPRQDARASPAQSMAMAKDKTQFTCHACGASSPKWLGKCPGCGAWNTLLEGPAETPGGAGKNRYQSLARSQPVATLSEIEATDFERTPTGQEELDRVLGGGIVAGGVTLMSWSTMYWPVSALSTS